MRLAICTRQFNDEATTGDEWEKTTGTRLRTWLDASLDICNFKDVFIATKGRAQGDLYTADFLSGSTINHFVVSPWGKFVPPLNALIMAVFDQDYDWALFASGHYAPERRSLDVLLRYAKDDMLMVGARLPEHDFDHLSNDGIHFHANGRQIPWLTYALVNLHHASRIGLQNVSDLGDTAGVEEIVFCTAQQRLNKSLRTMSPCVALVDTGQFPGMNTDGWNEDRHSKHDKKMATKVHRPQAQLRMLGLEGPTVQHISAEH